MQNFLIYTLRVRSLVDFSFSLIYCNEDKKWFQEYGAQFTLCI